MTILPITLRFGTMYTYFIEYLNTTICLKGGLQLYQLCEGIHIHQTVFPRFSTSKTR